MGFLQVLPGLKGDELQKMLFWLGGEKELRETSAEILGSSMKGKSRLKPGSNLRYRRLLAHILIFSVSEITADCKRLTDLRALYDIEVTHPGCQRARGVELGGMLGTCPYQYPATTKLSLAIFFIK